MKKNSKFCILDASNFKNFRKKKNRKTNWINGC